VVESSDARFNQAAKDYVRGRALLRALAGRAVRVRFEMPVEFKLPTRTNRRGVGDHPRRLAKRTTPRAGRRDLSLEVRDGEFFRAAPGRRVAEVRPCSAASRARGAHRGEILIGERGPSPASIPPHATSRWWFQTRPCTSPHRAQNLAFGLECGGPAARWPVGFRRPRCGLGARTAAAVVGGALRWERQRVALGSGAGARTAGLSDSTRPLASLEPALRGELRDVLVDLQRALGATVVYVTHDQVEAMTMGQADRVLEGGRLRQVARPPSCTACQPTSSSPASSKPGMNILGGRGRGTRDAGGVVDCGTWSVPVTLERYEGEIYLGVRPEHVSLVAPIREIGRRTCAASTARPGHAPSGSTAGGQPLVARCARHLGSPCRRPRGGEARPPAAHLFDAAERRLP